MLMIFFSVLKKNVWIVLILLEEKNNNEMKILDVAKRTQMRSSQNTIHTLVKVKYESDKTGY